jgi:hypothetical protein
LCVPKAEKRKEGNNTLWILPMTVWNIVYERERNAEGKNLQFSTHNNSNSNNILRRQRRWKKLFCSSASCHNLFNFMMPLLRLSFFFMPSISYA